LGFGVWGLGWGLGSGRRVDGSGCTGSSKRAERCKAQARVCNARTRVAKLSGASPSQPDSHPELYGDGTGGEVLELWHHQHLSGVGVAGCVWGVVGCVGGAGVLGIGVGGI